MRALVSLTLLLGLLTMTNAEEKTEPKPVVFESSIYIQAKYDDVWSHFTDPKKYGAWSSAPWATSRVGIWKSGRVIRCYWCSIMAKKR